MIQKLIDDALKAEQEKRKDRVSSNKFKPSLFGACYRRQWWSKTGEKETNPADERGLRVFKAGHLFHDFVQGFFENKQNEVLIEDDSFKGYADIVTENEVVDVKSIHSDGFWYLDKNILVTLQGGKEIRVKEGEIKDNRVRTRGVDFEVIGRKSISILDEKRNNWLQVGWYAKMLRKPSARLVFVSKDDLCIREYVIETEKLIPLVDEEISNLLSIKETPEGKPRLYKDDKECEYCVFKDKCKGTTC